MKRVKTAATSGLAISLFLMAAPAMAQAGHTADSGDHVDASGMPADHSTPAERAQTRVLNNQISQSNAAADAKAAEDNARYQRERANYAEQNARYHEAMQRHDMQVREYHERRQAYETLRARYAAERAAYRRHEWPGHHWVVLDRDIDPVGERVQLLSGARVGTVIDVSRSPGGRIEGLQVRLDDGKRVWIDNSDIRYNRTDGILMTNLDRRDLWAMAGESL
ncbi:MAG: hypothetical protein J0G99_07630 [Alphaproteobacteria bacterium]|nr:hypothetical protein [Alphaproteobacteria bacterium]